MILFTILFIILAILVVLAIAVLSVGGAAAIIIFSDLIVCIGLIVLIIRFLIKKRRK